MRRVVGAEGKSTGVLPQKKAPECAFFKEKQ